MNHRLDSEQIAAGLRQIAAFVRMAAWREAETLGLTPTQQACLSLLATRGSCRVTALAKLLGITQPTASDVIAALERKELVERRPDPGDARATRVHLTVAGAEIARQAARSPAVLLGAIETLSAAERAGVRRALSKIILSLQQAGAIEPQRLCLGCRFFQPYVHSDALSPHHCTFVDAAFGDASLRLDCSDHEDADPEQKASVLSAFGSDEESAPSTAMDEALICSNSLGKERSLSTMPQKAVFYHAGCSVCVDAERRLAHALNPAEYTVEIVHLGEAPDRIAEAEAAGVKSVPALVIDGKAYHINFGASLSEIKGAA